MSIEYRHDKNVGAGHYNKDENKRFYDTPDTPNPNMQMSVPGAEFFNMLNEEMKAMMKGLKLTFDGDAFSAQIAEELLKCINPTGSIIAMAVDKVPDGYLPCEGATIKRSTYKNLFDVIGETYGAGDGSTTFQIPDFRGMFLRGKGGNSADFGEKQEDAGRNAYGSVNLSGKDNVPAKAWSSATGVFRASGEQIPYAGFKYESSVTSVTHVSPFLSMDLGNEWGSSHTANEFRPVNYAVKYCIKY